MSGKKDHSVWGKDLKSRIVNVKKSFGIEVSFHLMRSVQSVRYIPDVGPSCEYLPGPIITSILATFIIWGRGKIEIKILDCAI